jgi:carbon storage regulator
MATHNTQKRRANLKHKEGNMLVLSRKPMERIHIGDSVVVTVLEVRGNKARIGIDAPDNIHVLRSELLDRVSNASGNGSRATVGSAEPYDPGGIEAMETDGPSG